MPISSRLIDDLVADWLAGAGACSPSWPTEERLAAPSGPRRGWHWDAAGKGQQVGRTGRPGALSHRDASHRPSLLSSCTPLEQRAICLAVAGAGQGALTQSQIAELLGVTQSTAKRAIARARNKIEKAITRDARRSPGWGDPESTT